MLDFPEPNQLLRLDGLYFIEAEYEVLSAKIIKKKGEKNERRNHKI